MKYRTTPLDSTGAAWGSGCKEHSTGWWQCCENMRLWAGQEYVQVWQLPEEGCCKLPAWAKVSGFCKSDCLSFWNLTPCSWYWLFRGTFYYHYQGWWIWAQCDNEMKWKTVLAGWHYTIFPSTSSGYDSAYTWQPAYANSLALTTSATTCTQFLELCRWKEHVPPKLQCQPKHLHAVKT